MSAARAFSRTKPIVAYKGGRFAESAQAAASHTGALAGVDAVYDAAFQRAGVERINEVSDMFDCAELLARQRPAKGDRLAVVTNAGGPGVMAVDALIGRDGHMASLGDATIDALNRCLPPFWSHGNPIDVLGDAPAKRYADAMQIVLDDAGVDAVLVVLTPQAMTDPTATAEAVAQVARKARKPVLASWMGGTMVSDGVQILNQAGVPTYKAPEMAVRAFMHMVSYARNLEILHVTPRDIPVAFLLVRIRLRGLLDTLMTEGNEILSENVSKSFLEGYDIPISKPLLARNADEAVHVAKNQCGYPVVMKIHSPDITHKTEVAGVTLNLSTDDGVRAAFGKMIETAKERRPDARITGVTLQPMVSHPNSFELLVGAKKDPVFGAVIMVGMGGTAAEVFRDRALGLPPLNEALARRMLESLKSWPLLRGYRGKPGADIDRLIEVIMRFSYLVADYPEIKEVDVNPLLVTPDGVIALDARVIVDRDLVIQAARPYSHLAISPYPEEYVTTRELKDHVPIILRPIKPEDEPMWHDLLGSCSPESLRYRFSGVFKETTHDMATRFCFIDYDREIGIVAEVEEEGQRRLIGVGRLVADVDHVTAEYAIIVADRGHGRGVGGQLTDYCLEVAKQWGVKKIVAETASDNVPMLRVFRTRGFDVNIDREEDIVFVSKAID
jgi:acetyltransferase